MRRFYLFVKAVVRYNRKNKPSEEDIRRLIQERSLRLDTEYLERLEHEYSSLYANLLEYEKTIEYFPDPLTEHNNPVRYYYRLIQLYGHDRENEVVEIMRREWGDGWETLMKSRTE